jgi:putative membrane protein
MIYGASAGLLLAFGLLRVFFFEKGAAYYFGNPYFIAKLALFIGAALLSVYPTVVYLSWRPALREDRAPQISPLQARRIPLLLRLQLAAIAGAIFCAPFMAKGFR